MFLQVESNQPSSGKLTNDIPLNVKNPANIPIPESNIVHVAASIRKQLEEYKSASYLVNLPSIYCQYPNTLQRLRHQTSSISKRKDRLISILTNHFEEVLLSYLRYEDFLRY